MLSSSLLRPIFQCMTRDTDDPEDVWAEKASINALQELIDEHVTSAHPEYDKACELLSKYPKTKKAEHLIRLYSLEMPFYRHIGIHIDCLWYPPLVQKASVRLQSMRSSLDGLFQLRVVKT